VLNSSAKQKRQTGTPNRRSKQGYAPKALNKKPSRSWGIFIKDVVVKDVVVKDVVVKDIFIKDIVIKKY
jgi:hypothetical protein